MHEAEFFKPEKHEYVTHHTYTGPNCAICGKVEPATHHQNQKENKMDKADAFDLMLEFIESLANGKSGDIQITQEAENILNLIAGRNILVDVEE